MGAIKVLPADIVRRNTGVTGKQNKKITWHTSEVIVKPFLTLNGYMTVVHNILDDCRAPDGSIAPEMIDFAVKVNIITAYGFVELPEDVDDLFYIIYSSDLYESIYSAANKGQIDSIIKSVWAYVNGGIGNGKP